MRKLSLLLCLPVLLFVACSSGDTSNAAVLKSQAGAHSNSEDTQKTNQQISGTWNQVGQKCDAAGANCKEMANEVVWNFNGTTLTKGGNSQNYVVAGKWILIGERQSKYEVTSRTDDVLILHAITMNRYMKLEKK